MQLSAKWCGVVMLGCALAWGAVGCGDEEDEGQTPANNSASNNSVNNAPNNSANNAPNNSVNNAVNNSVNNAPNNAVNNSPEAFTGEMPQGLYLVGLAVAPLGGFTLPLQMEVESDNTAKVMTSVKLRAVASDGGVSEVLAEVASVSVESDGSFTLDFPSATLPGEYTPTGSDVEVEVVFSGVVGEGGLFCGDVTGAVVSLELDLAGSTFGSVAWDARGDVAPATCDAEPPQPLPRIETCPAVVEGMNGGFMSGGEAREFLVSLPEGYEAGSSWPVIFVFHGFGGTAGGILETGVEGEATASGAIVVAMQGLGGEDAFWDVLRSPVVNGDLAFFDDTLKCVSESFSVDAERVHVTGMSYGGLMTGFLLTHRSEVIASAAPFSGGVLGGYRPTEYKMPVLVSWGGEADLAFEQNFELLATSLTAGLRANDQFVVTCDHGQEHVILPEFWPWAVDFLLDHPRGVDPEPYAGGLPGSFPAYCAIAP